MHLFIFFGHSSRCCSLLSDPLAATWQFRGPQASCQSWSMGVLDCWRQEDKGDQTTLDCPPSSPPLMSHEGTSPTIAPPKLQLEPKLTPTSSVGAGVEEELVLPQLHHQNDTTRRSII